MVQATTSVGGGLVPGSMRRTGNLAVSRAMPEAVTVTCADVDTALAHVASTRPELAQCMAVARAMLCRLDTIRDEAKLGACIAREHCKLGNVAEADKQLGSLIGWLGQWGNTHVLDL